MKKNIAILAGGNSSEYEISMLTASHILENMDSELYVPYLVELKGKDWNVLLNNKKYTVDTLTFSFKKDNQNIPFNSAFIAIHGTPGENGILQGWLELLEISYSGCGVLSSALGFNKGTCNQYLQSQGITIIDAVQISLNETYSKNKIIEKTGLPCFVKPCESGSSFGITKVRKKEDLDTAIQEAFKESNEVLVETFIEGIELSCGVLKTRKEEIIFPVTEIRYKSDFFDYNAKYFSKETEEITPACISEKMSTEIQNISSKIYDILKCKGIIRVDFIVKNGIPYFIELNTVPGMTKMSIITNQIKATSWSFKEILTKIIEDSL